MSTSLYRHFAADGSLLYVGISLSWPERTKAHAGRSRWFEQVARVEIEQFETREEALRAEREAIKRERPKFNVVHNAPPRQRITSRKKAFDAHLKLWVKVGLALREPAPTCVRCRQETSRRQRWYNTATKEHLCNRCYDKWRSMVEPRERQSRPADPLLDLITGPDAIVGPPLVYRDDNVSVIIAHGEAGKAGVLDEIILGRFCSDEVPSYAHLCATVLTIRRGDDITIAEAREARDAMVKKLREHLRSVEQVESDLALAVANASTFPSKKARKVLDEVASERGVVA